MKKIVMLTVIVMLMAVVTAAQAEVRAGSVSVTPFVGGYFFEKNQDLKDSLVYGLRAGYNVTEHLGVEGFFGYTQTEIDDDTHYAHYWKPWQDIYSYGIEGLYHFMPNGRFVPFIALGLGGMYYSEGKTYRTDYGDQFKSNKFSVDYGAGVKFFLTDNIALRADIRHMLPLNGTWNNPDNVHNDFMTSFGINFAFGGEKKEVAETKAEEPVAPAPPAVYVAPVEVVVDSDNDGVTDNLDKCPNTPAGVAVNKKGCPLDSDMDGIVDYLDKCPNTPAGVAVNKDGCPLDSDRDGVPDYLDKCPDTPAGVAVDKDGCVPKKVSIAINIVFDTRKAVVKRKYYATIKNVADFMKEHPETKVVIHGHTDNVDIFNNPETNIKLSQARAESVRKCLIDNFGIKASRITAVGHGPNNPIATNDTKEGRQKNRRIEAVVETMQIK